MESVGFVFDAASKSDNHNSPASNTLPRIKVYRVSECKIIRGDQTHFLHIQQQPYW